MARQPLMTSRPSPTTRPAISATDREAEQLAAIMRAPDAAAVDQPAEPVKAVGVMRGNRRHITHTLDPAVLDRLDAYAKSKWRSRASVINEAIEAYLDTHDV